MVITARLTSIAFDYQDGIFDNKARQAPHCSVNDVFFIRLNELSLPSRGTV